MQGSVGLTGSPERSIEEIIELVMKRKEVADVVPATGGVAVVQIFESRSGLPDTVLERFREGGGLSADDHQGRGFERFDESGGVADRDDVPNPGPLVAAGPELHYARRGGDFWIFSQELVEGGFVADKGGSINVAAVDKVFVFDLPAPSGVHGLGSGVWEDWLRGARPATDNGAVAEESITIAVIRFAQQTAEQFRAEARGINVEIRGNALASFGNQRGNAVPTGFGADRGVQEINLLVAATVFEPGDELFVFDVEGVVVVELGKTVGQTRKDLALAMKAEERPSQGYWSL